MRAPTTCSGPRRTTRNWTGCGNCLDLAEPLCQAGGQLAAPLGPDLWRRRGFRFDLAPVLIAGARARRHARPRECGFFAAFALPVSAGSVRLIAGSLGHRPGRLSASAPSHAGLERVERPVPRHDPGLVAAQCGRPRHLHGHRIGLYLLVQQARMDRRQLHPPRDLHAARSGQLRYKLHPHKPVLTTTTDFTISGTAAGDRHQMLLVLAPATDAARVAIGSAEHAGLLLRRQDRPRTSETTTTPLPGPTRSRWTLILWNNDLLLPPPPHLGH